MAAPVPSPSPAAFEGGPGGGGFVPAWKWQEGIHYRKPRKKIAPPPVIEIAAKPIEPPVDLEKVLGPIDDEEIILALLMDEP